MRLGSKEQKVPRGEVDKGVEDRGAGGGETSSAEDVQDGGPEEGRVQGRGIHCFLVFERCTGEKVYVEDRWMCAGSWGGLRLGADTRCASAIEG